MSHFWGVVLGKVAAWAVLWGIALIYLAIHNAIENARTDKWWRDIESRLTLVDDGVNPPYYIDPSILRKQ